MAKSFAHFILDMAIRAVIFVLPTAFLAQWCDIQPTWKSSAFMLFCIVWSDMVFDSARSPFKRDDDVVRVPKRTLAVLTPDEVAAEARKIAPWMND